jgi:hypothetical protein
VLIADTEVCFRSPGERRRERLRLRDRSLRPFNAEGADLDDARAKRERSLAERVGFEPTVEFPLHTLSKRAPSTTRTSLRGFSINSLGRAVQP